MYIKLYAAINNSNGDGGSKCVQYVNTVSDVLRELVR